MKRYGYHPWRALYVLAALLALGLIAAAVAHADDQDDQFVALVAAQTFPVSPSS
jgi:hypothetical protein